MTKWLASVQSLQEAQALTEALPDILDMKNPAKGALGRLQHDIVAAVVDWAAGRCRTSATVGDLPMQPEVIAAALQQMATTGVDYLKVGLFDDLQLQDCLSKLAPAVKALNTPIIAVIFADQLPKLSLIAPLKQSGFAGVMVDTAEKNGNSLRDLWSEAQLQQFVAAVKQQGMLCGLAGALKIGDIAPLKRLGADYLGFRSALCDRRQRSTQLRPELAAQVQHHMRGPLSLAS